MAHDYFVAALALTGLVILVASLLSGLVERSGLPQVGIFLLLGAMLGPAGLGVVDLTLESEAIEVLAVLGLVLVLFTDAIAVDIGEVRIHRKLAALILGPGTLLPAALIGLAACLLLGLPPAAAAILGAALASTDPVLLRTLIRNPALPPPARLALRLESGMNDVILLPVVVLAMLALRSGGSPAPAEVGHLAMGLFLLGPLLGVVVGYVAITLLDRVRSRLGVRRDYESLYALGVAFSAFAAAEAVGGSGFLAAFAAGLVVAAMDVELCDCFLDYGEASAEMFLLLTFVAFGASIIWTGFQVADVPTLIFAAVALSVRTLVLLPVLRLGGVDPQNRKIIALLGPRGLSALLLALLPVFAGIDGSVSCSRSPAWSCCCRWWCTGPPSRTSSAGMPRRATPAPPRPLQRRGSKSRRRSRSALRSRPRPPRGARRSTWARRCPRRSPSPSCAGCGRRAGR